MKKILLVFLMIGAALSALAQESNCGDGIDNDGDGFIDCFDSNCANSVSCKDFYVGRDKLCQVPPTGVAKFEMKLAAKSPDRTTWTSGTMVVGDLDNDGIPEVVTLHQDNKKIYILDGRDLSIKYPLGGAITGAAEYFDHTIGNVKKDNCGDIFIAEKDGGIFYISSYDCKGVQQWRVPIYGQPITMGLADFDADGKVELYYRNEILDAETGVRLVKGSGTWTTIDAGPVAVDILDDGACTDCAGLELVLGGNIYAVNLGARTVDAGTLSLAKSIPAGASYYPKLTSFGWVSSLTSVADYNQDGSLDVLMSGATGSTGGATTVFFWDVKNSTYKVYQPPNNWQHGTGRINIADIDGDGKSNATFVSGNRLYALKEDFTPLWPAISISINEGTSGYTSTTVFDFNNDKAVEIVYRDEAYLYIINGKTGSVFTQATCRSRTANDYPVVVDVDGDGSTEICVICATNDTDNINDIARAPYGQVRTYKSNLEAWVPARKVWNQHGYFNVNVNDDLTIPRIQQKHHLVFSTGSCTTGDNRALNTFLNQSPFLDTKGCPTYASPDITYDAASVKITPPTCPDQAFKISMNIKNIGDLGLSGILPITFYQGNPTQAGAVKLNTVNINLTKFNVNDVVSLTDMNVQGTGATFTLYVVLNDNGSTVPTPIKLPNATFTECNYTNNIVSASVSPTPFTIQTAKISDDIKCGTNPVPPNGAAEVYRLVGATKETVGYTFYWFDSPTVGDTALAVFKGPVRTGLAAGTYSIIAYHKGVKCGSTSAQVVIGQQNRTPTAVITEDKPYTSCKNPDGKLTVTINGGDPFGNYTYEWFEGNVFGTSPILSKSHVITNVSNVVYSVLVTEKATGCQVLASSKVTDNTVTPVVTTSVTPANCNPANSGSASAKVGNATNGYDFYWYDGGSVKPSSDHSGSTYSSISPGDYTVVATDKSTGCSSAPVVATVVFKTIVPVTATVTSHQTSCTTPTGAASALVSGSTTGYTFKWFSGNNTLGSPIGSSSTIAGLAAGVYTVEAKNTSNGCIDTEIVTIDDTYANPKVTAATTINNTNCTGITPNGLITINIDDVAPVAGQFTVQWFEGSGTTTPLGTTVGSVTGVSNKTAQRLSAGTYTVRVTDIVAPSNGCSTTTTFTITNTPAAVTIDNLDIILGHQSNCSPVNGSATVSEITVNGTGLGNTTGYTFKWSLSNGTTVIPSSGSAATIAVPLAAGSYFVQATNTATNCKSANTPFTINDTHLNPLVAAATTINNTNCTGVTQNGSITINIDGAAPVAGQFNVQWFEGNGTTTALGTTVGSVTGVSNKTAQALSAGTYTVRVTDLITPNNGCSTTTTFTITNTPAAITIDNADIALGHQSNCSPLNGSATVNEITVNGAGLGNTTGYTFKWFQSNGTTVIPSSGSAATIAVPLAAGSYFVQATNTTTNCKSPNTPFTINDTHLNPLVAAATTINNTNCTGATPNGSITINIDGVAPVAGQFNVEWFEGNGTTTTLGTTVGSVTGVSNKTAQALSAGTYTVRVTDLITPNTGCSTTTTFTITSTPAAVTIDNLDIALSHQSDCSPLNGSATVNEITVNGIGTGNAGGYTFKWFQSNGTTVIAGSGSAATIAVPLAGGSYFVQATSTTTNCKSPIAPFTINDTHLNPLVAAATTINNTNCTGATPNGSITINVGGVAPAAAQFNVEWFEGNGTTTALGATVGSVAGTNNQTAQALSAGTYTVRVTDLVTPNTGCSTTTTFTITNTPAVVTIDNADITLGHQTNCSPVNGSATVNEITVNGLGAGNAAGYTFTWFLSNGTTVIPGSGNAATIAVPLAAGNYIVQATSTATNCKSANTPFTINDTHLNPLVAAATTINNTNCTGATPNGSITINIDGVAPVAGQFNVQWFEGNGTTTALGTNVGSVTGVSNKTAQALSAGTYTVRVTDLVTPNNGCSTTTTFTITNTPAVVTIDNADIGLTHQSDCTPVNGLATVNEITVGGAGIGNTTNYTFTWYQSNGTTVIPGSGAAATVGVALAAGTYFVKATSTTTNCSSAITTFTINDTHVNPAVTPATTINNTNCTGVTPNGSVTINIGGVAPVAGQHNIEWFEGNGTTVTLGTNVGSVAGANNQTAQALSAGTYTVRVTDLVTPNNGCSTTTTFTITNTPAVVTIDNADIGLTHQTNCSPVNGSATVNEITVNGLGAGNAAGYTFTWFLSNGTTVIPGSGNAATIAVPLAAGNYIVQATSTATNCKSANTPFTINDTHLNPLVAAATTINNTNCTGATPNGSITINIDGVAPVAGQYNIEWFEGNGTTVTLGTNVGSVAGANNQTAQALSAGTYTVRVTDLVTPNNGCSTTTTFTITNTPAVVTIDNADIGLTHQSDCTPVNGLATVNEITVGGAGIGNTTNYTFTWYQSNGTTVIPGSGAAATVGVALAAGTYFVKATSTTTNCSSAITTFTINDTHVNPAVTPATTINNTNCTGVTPNGSVTINIGGVAPVAGQHNIEWFEGNGTTVTLGTNVGSVAGANNQTAQALSAGTYTVRVTDLVTPNTGCSATTTFTITNTLAVVTIDNLDITLGHQSNCSPVNGSATVNEITVNGTGAGNATGYTFKWLQSNGTTVIPGSGNAAIIGVPLAAGSYFVQATSTATNCKSAITPFTINDTHINPVIAPAATVNNTNCTGVSPNGSITIQINGGASVADFTIEWFEGNGTSTPLGTTVGSTGGLNNEIAQGINGGTYTARVTDNVTPSSGCSFTASFTITDNLTYPVPGGTPIANTACDPTKSNGSIQAFVGGPPAAYTFNIFRGQNTLTANKITLTGPDIADKLEAGIYTVQAITVATGCSATTEVSVINNIVLPTINATATTMVNSCSTPDGSATVTAVSIGVPADYTFSWYRGNNLKAVADYTGSTINGLLAGNYTVTATNNVLGCDVQVPVTVTVNNDPSTLITIAELPGEQLQPAVCNDGQGQLAVQATSPVNTLGFTFSWFEGDKNLGLTMPSEGSGQDFPTNSNRISNAASLEPISSGLHTVIALDKNTGCQDSLTIYLPFSDEALLVSVLTFPQTDCLAPDGAFEASITPSAGTLGNPLNAGLDQGWYELQIYQNGSLIHTAPGTPGLPYTDPIIVTGLAAGNYTVLAVETQMPPLPGCSSIPNDINIGDSRTYPVITGNVLTDNKNCVGSGSDTGSISLTVDGVPTPGVGYSYTWYDGKLTTTLLPGANVLAPGHSAINIDGGFYTVEVTSAANNCKAQETLNIANIPYVISIASADLDITPQTDCSPGNGLAEVQDVFVDGISSGGTGGYTFQWFLNDGTSIIPLSSTNANVGTPIAAANYFVKATNTTSNCASPLVQFIVDDASVKPLITQNTIINNTNCSGAPSNGSITIDVNGGVPSATDYTIKWYSGIGTSGAVIGTTETLANLGAGDYTVEVIDMLSPDRTCSSTAVFTIVDDLPVFTITSTSITVGDQTDCVANGSAEVTDILIDGVTNGGTTGFTFEWFDDAGVSIDGPGPSAIVGVSLAAGNYRVVATSTTSLCSSSVGLFTVNDVSVTPVITQNTIINNTNCTGAPSNGSITIDVNGGVPTATDYTIKWYSGTGTSGAVIGTTETLANLGAGDYTVEVTDILSPDNTCSSTAVFTIIDDLPVLTIDNASITVRNQDDCVANGSAEVMDVLIDGITNSGTSGFTFEWFDDAGVSIDGPGPSAIVGVSLAAGNYRVVATSTTSLCSSSVGLFTVNDVSVTPVITQNTIINNTNCTGAPSNGSITIDVNGGVPAATDYTIKWYSGTGTSGAVIGTTETLANLGAGDYTVEVTDILSPDNTCSSTAVFTVIDDLPVLTINSASITVRNQDDCVANGSAEVMDVLIDGITNSGTSGFTFEWFDDAGVSIDGPSPSAIVGVSLAAGNYRVVATSTTSLCSSSVGLFTVNDVSVTPVITQNTIINNTNCSGAPTNGSITIDVNGGVPTATDYTIKWYSGTGTSGAVIGTTETLANLGAGDYTVEVTDILSPDNTCSSTAVFTIIDDLPVLTIDNASITVRNQDDCVANGSAEVMDILIDGITNSGTSGFTFEWFDDAGVSIDGPGPSAIVGVSLAAGNYRVVATSTTSLCSSSVGLFTVNDVSVTPVITQNTIINNTNCTGAPSNGSITIDVNGGVPSATDYTIKWYSGTGTSGAVIGTTETLANLGAGDYTVEVTDILSPDNTCSSTAVFTIIDDLPVLTIDNASITVRNQDDCVANGSAEVMDILIDGITNSGTSGFTFEWFDDAGVSIDGPGPSAIVGVSLAAGNYRVVATSTTSLCSSSVGLFTVNDVSVTPVITQNTIINNTNCTGAPSNGSITIDVNGGVPTATDYTIKWYSGTGTSGAVIGTTETLANLGAGDYTVEVTDILSPDNTCSSTAVFTVIDDLPVLTINSASITVRNQDDCVANGSAEVMDILIDGITNSGTSGFTFEWFDDAGVSIDGPGPSAIVGVSLAAGNYRVVATSTTSLCSSSVGLFTVNDVSVTPVITQNTIINNTNCTGAPSNGSITIDVNGGVPAATDYTIKWYSGTGTSGAVIGTTETLANLGAGDYTVEVTDILSPDNTCSSTAVFTIIDDLPVLTIDNASITVRNQDDCVANGSAEVMDVLIDGITNSGTSGFTFEWFDDAGVSIDGPGPSAIVGVSLAAGNYRVVATSTTSLCSSSVGLFTVNDVSVTPVITQNTIINNTNCTGAPSNGSITIDVNGGVPAATDYTIKWYSGTGTSGAVIGTTETLANLSAGDYTVEVTDILSPGNTCSSTATFTVIEIPNIVGINSNDIATTDISDCQPAIGSASVTNVSFNGVAVGNTTGYVFEWLQSDLTPVDPGNGPTVGVNLTANDYYVRATHVASNCISLVTPFSIKDVTVTPVVVAIKDFDNIACNTNYTGQLRASVSEGSTSGVTAGYTFEWFSGMNNTNAADLISSGPVLSGMREGDYTVLVTDTSTPSGNCTSIATLTIERKIPAFNGTLTANAQTMCMPVQDGNMTVNSIQQFLAGVTTSFDMSNAIDRNKFSFQWFDESLASITPVSNGNNISPNLEEGTFYVQITDALGCTSDYITGVIDDQTAKPQIALDEFKNPAVCILPEVKGSLFVSADNSSNWADYTFEWFEGNNTTGTLVAPNSPDLSNIDYTGILEYTTRVTNITTQCFSLETYKFKTDTVAIQVVASAVPLTSCVTDNGSLFAATRTGSGQLYTIEWYKGTVVGTTPDFTSNEVLIAPVGTYTAVAKHPTLNFCPLIPDTLSVTDGRLYPKPTLMQKAPLTYCDPSNPNGVAVATVNGNVIGYTFDWYEGSATNSTYTGSEAGILRAATYVVKATDVISGCAGTSSITIGNDPLAIPLPKITLLSDRTDCEIHDGSLSADVNGVTSGHIFNWYNGGGVKNQVDALGEIYDALDVGVYTLTATDRTSGCTSMPVQREIISAMLYPDFDIVTVNTNCNDNIGTASIKLSGHVEVKEIQWDIERAIEVGPQASALPSGVFEVTAISFKNCRTLKTFEIKTDISIYNGVSRNSDGLNDIFEVGCIGEYPNNSVRIYNRAGSLVFEASGYDNEDIYFDGISNRGVNILGNDLPDGTYFYIINKGDGSEAKTGYLELLH